MPFFLSFCLPRSCWEESNWYSLEKRFYLCNQIRHISTWWVSALALSLQREKGTLLSNHSRPKKKPNFNWRRIKSRKFAMDSICTTKRRKEKFPLLLSAQWWKISAIIWNPINWPNASMRSMAMVREQNPLSLPFGHDLTSRCSSFLHRQWNRGLRT